MYGSAGNTVVFCSARKTVVPRSKSAREDLPMRTKQSFPDVTNL